ncbi:hypothetical protein KIH86_07575 [Paenibacillus sp. HN-1]|uniref:hypothetical protein n=1 Tax=Paenibacillus TaxID=44249 RepID=UPI001CA8BAAF|nr:MULTISPECIES: hypothetical protein [Paenibacillus]MBY9080997.1 hypothetical protein [Paenibacillus sp. CGMCC 1.18879]MBY9084099.1 hypothetical protein [Paenibacillus sinensis]
MAKAEDKAGSAQELESTPDLNAGNTKEAETATKYPVQELLDHSVALFLYGPEVLSGALYDREIKELTVDEARTLISKFLNKRVN